MRLRLFPNLPVFALSLAVALPAALTAQSTDLNGRSHDSEQWQAIAPHLANPATATADELEAQADILRARRFPQDSLDYYKDALDRGGNASRLLNKMGLIEMEMRNFQLARLYFVRSLKLGKNANTWNNLGAAEYLTGLPAGAIADYKKAVKLDKRQAVYHANLATAYFERKDYDSARKEMGLALKLDPEIFERKDGQGGVAAHVLSSDDRAQFAMEMAKMYARAGLIDDMLHSLAIASEAGLDVQREMRSDAALAKLTNDPRVVVLVRNARALRASRGSGSAAAGLPPALPAPPISN